MALYLSAARQIHLFITGERLSRMADQGCKPRELIAGQRHRLLFKEHLTDTEIKLELAKGDDSLFLRRRRRQLVSLPSQYRADTRQQFTGVTGLGI